MRLECILLWQQRRRKFSSKDGINFTVPRLRVADIAVVAVGASCDWNKWHEDLQNITSMAQTMLDIAQTHRSVHEVIKLCR